MKYKLTKLSTPGWKREYDNVQDLLVDLDDCICFTCKDEFEEQYGTTPKSVPELMMTACGCEYYFQNDDFEKQFVNFCNVEDEV